MTTTDGGPAPPGADARTRARDQGGGVNAARAPRLRTVLALGRVEASLLASSPASTSRLRASMDASTLPTASTVRSRGAWAAATPPPWSRAWVGASAPGSAGPPSVVVIGHLPRGTAAGSRLRPLA